MSPQDESLTTKANMLDFTYKAYYIFYNVARDPYSRNRFFSVILIKYLNALIYSGILGARLGPELEHE